MKLPSAMLLMRLWCVQVIAVLPLGAQLTEWNASADHSASSLSSIQSNTDQEVSLKPDGLNTNSGWALNRVGEKFSAPSVTTYAFPDTTTPVRLYLIDTAVREPETFRTANSNLKSWEIIPVGGASPTPRDHGTQMLSLIAGIGTGIATGTPIHVVNYDIYAGSSSTTDPTTSVTNLASAIAKAVTHSRHPNTVAMRSVICIATSSGTAASKTAIDDSINAALAAGITVVVSAGNLGADAASYTPPSNGIKNGVICVGASDGNNLKIPMSNYGNPVDILAPGFEVNTRSQSATSPIVVMTGTSPATALVAGAVLAKLSASPTFTPAGVESSVKAAAKAMPSGPHVLRSIVAPSSEFASPDVVPDGPILIDGATSPVSLGSAPSGAAALIPPPSSPMAAPAPPPVDSDSDGISDIVEIFHGMSQGTPPSPVIALDANRQIQFKFPIDQSLLDGAVSGNSFVLRNGYSWKISCSSNFSNWSVPVGSLSKSTDAQGQAWLTASFPAGTQPSCFARIEVIAP